MTARRGLVPLMLLAALTWLWFARREPYVPLMREDDLASVASVPLPATEAPATIEELRRRIAEVLERDGVPGVAIALVGRDGPIWVGGVGVADVATGRPMDADTVFRVGSLSKSIVALAVMRLVDQGKLDVDRPLRALLPSAGIDNPWDDVAPVTLAHCLEHTAGLDEMRFNEIFTDDERISTARTLELNPRSRRIRWRPGTRHAYSNVGFTLAARAIEVASGESFDQYVRREVFAPLGIEDADYHRTPRLEQRLATGYLERGRAAPYVPFAHRPGGALLASAADFARLVHFWLRRGDGFPSIVSPEGLARIETSGTLPYPHLDAEYGFANYGDVNHPVFGRGHDGGMPGFHASYRYFPELGAGYAMMLNSTYAFQGYREIRALLFAYLARGRSFAPPPTPPPGTAERPRAEFYGFAAPRSEVFGFIDLATEGWRVVETPGGLRLHHLMWPPVPLVPTADGGYRHPHESGSSVRFTTNADGVPVSLWYFDYAEAASWWSARVRIVALGLGAMLLRFAPLWAAIVLGIGVIRRRRVVPDGLVLWPAIAGLSYLAIPRVFEAAVVDGVIGGVHPLTIGICALTILLPVSALASMFVAIRWMRRPDRPSFAHRLVPTACALAAFGIALWFALNGLIGFRTWAW
jgi:CubicO group peptidase (beta-lactamase class C family)